MTSDYTDTGRSLDDLSDLGRDLADAGATGAHRPIPERVVLTDAFARRLPTQRVLDALAKIEPVPFGELVAAQPSRVLAFRALLREFPERDVTSLWLAAYDVEVELTEADPTERHAPPPSPPSVPTTG